MAFVRSQSSGPSQIIKQLHKMSLERTGKPLTESEEWLDDLLLEVPVAKGFKFFFFGHIFPFQGSSATEEEGSRFPHTDES